MAQRQRQGAHEPEPARDADQLTGNVRDQLRPRRLAHEQLDLLVRPLAVERGAVKLRAAAAGRGPLLAAAEVVDETEDDVALDRPLSDRERERDDGDAALRVRGAFDRAERNPCSAPAERPLAELLRHQREFMAL